MSPKKKRKFSMPAGIICLTITLAIFIYLGSVMGTANMLNTMMHTAHDLLVNTVLFLMAICVLMGALSRIFADFGVVSLFEKLLRPLMKPLFGLPGAASIGAVMTFMSDNPAIITLAKDKKFARFFKKYQLVSLTNFGTAFGMGLIVIVFMMGQGYMKEPLIGLAGAFIGCIVSTRLMQRFTVKSYPQYKEENAIELPEDVQWDHDENEKESKAGNAPSLFMRILNALLDGGKSGVEIGLAIIPGVLIISTFVMLLTFGPSASGAYTGAAYEGTELLPVAAGKIGFLFDWLFGFKDTHLVAFPITALGAVGAAIGLIPGFDAAGWVDGNAIAVCTAIGMCWSGYLSTHTAMLDTLGYRHLTSKAIGAHTIGGLVAGIAAHWLFVLVSLIPSGAAAEEPVQPVQVFTDQEIALVTSQITEQSDSMLLRVYTVEDESDLAVLRATCTYIPAEGIGTELYNTIAKALVETVTSPQQDGVGIAGPQVGINRRIVAVQRFDKEGEPFEVYPNIRITALRGEQVPGPEGCLSVPGRRGDVLRWQDIDITYTSPVTRQDTTETVQGYTAVIFQHETDHLDGVLYTDKLNEN